MKTYTSAAPMSEQMRRILSDSKASETLFDQLVKDRSDKATIRINGDDVTVTASPNRSPRRTGKK